MSIATLIPEGANPHLYEPTPRTIAQLQDALLWIRLGESFDHKMLQVFQDQNPDIHIVNIAEGIDLLSERPHPECHHCHNTDEGKDMHIWLSPRLAKIQATTIANALSALFPENAPLYTDRLNALCQQLDELDQELTEMLAPKRGEAILVSHPAFAYFCRDYGLIQLSIEMEGKDPLPQHVTHLLKKARQYHVSTVLIEPQYSNKGAELIAKELGLSTTLVDPYAEDYLNNLKDIGKIIAQ